MKEHDIWGWSRHSTAGQVRSVVTISGEDGDDLFMVVRREVDGVTKHYLERLVPRWKEDDGIASAVYVDAGKSFYSEAGSTSVTGLGLAEGTDVDLLPAGTSEDNRVAPAGGDACHADMSQCQS